MSYPEHPETIILKNNFYPKGLTEKDIYEYYQKVKSLILTETRNRDLMFYIFTDLNKPIIRRHLGDQNFIRLTPENYDEVITGRIVSIHAAMGLYEDFGIVDIDADESIRFDVVKRATFDVYSFLMDKVPFIRGVNIRFTGKTGFHLVCKFPRRVHIDTIRFMLKKTLIESELTKRYTVEAKRRVNVPNIDLSSDKNRGNFILKDALSILGLRCMEIGFGQLMGFDKKMALLR